MAACPPIVRIRILLRPCVIVGSAAGLKRIFQVPLHVAADLCSWLLHLDPIMQPFVRVMTGRLSVQTKQRLYEKDLDFSYHPFLPILGSGLVTANGALWQTQRVLIGPALRMDILDDVVEIAKSAVDRLSKKLATAKARFPFVPCSGGAVLASVTTQSQPHLGQFCNASPDIGLKATEMPCREPGSQ